VSWAQPAEGGKSRLEQRLEPSYLRRLRQAVLEFRARPRQVPLPLAGLNDYRVVVHAHSNLSYDSPGTLEEIVGGAQAAEVQAIFMSEHPGPDFDFFADGLRGVHGGVLFYPGAEARGFIIYPTRVTDINAPPDEQTLIDEIVAQDGLIFFSHPEWRENWDLHGMTGMEIYNTHADMLDEEGGLEGLLMPGGQLSVGRVLQLLAVLQQYPNECLPAIFDPNTEILQRWDELCQRQRVTGVAANDSHANVGAVATYEEGDEILVRDLLGNEVARLPAKGVGLGSLLGRGPKPGAVLLRIQVDPYAISFGYVSTHVLAPELSEEALMEALREGRCYVAFDWIADPTGFRFEAEEGGQIYPMGSVLWVAPERGQSLAGTVTTERPPVKLRVRTPIAARVRLLRDGQVISETEADALDCAAPGPGVYRVEVWTTLAGQDYAWIYSNPIYLREARPAP